MTNNFIPPRWIVITGITATLILIAAAIFRIITPPEPKVPRTDIVTKNINNSTSTFGQIDFKGTPPNFPETLPVALIRPGATSIQSVIDQMIGDFGLTPNANVKNVWTGQSYSLSKDPFDDTYLLVKQGATPAENLRPVDLGAAQAAGQNFIATYFPGLAIVPIPTTANYFINHGHFETSPPQTATVVSLSFSYTIQDIPVFYKSQSEYPFFMFVDSENQILKFIFSPQLITFDLQPTPKKVLSIDQALSNIKSGQGAIISATQGMNQPLSLKVITSAILDDVKLEYREDVETQLIYPFFRFTGTAKNNQNDDLNVEIITPAVGTSRP